jgi:hypothetical protein
MRTAIFVYATTPMTITTSESGLVLCGMTAAPVTLSQGSNQQSVAPGIYKILSSYGVQVTSSNATFDFVASETKTHIPTLPAQAEASFSSVSNAALQDFFNDDDDARTFANH